jgi:hypothetical protein
LRNDAIPSQSHHLRDFSEIDVVVLDNHVVLRTYNSFSGPVGAAPPTSASQFRQGFALDIFLVPDFYIIRVAEFAGGVFLISTVFRSN